MGHLDRLVVCLRVLVYAAMAYSIARVASGLIDGESLDFTIHGTPWTGNLRDLAARDAFAVGVFLWMSQVPWLAAMLHVEGIARAAGRREFFSPGIARHFNRLSWAVLAYAVLECCERPATALYLSAARLVPGTPDIALSDVIRVKLLLVTALFFVITRIVEVGVRLKDDADLTI